MDEQNAQSSGGENSAGAPGSAPQPRSPRITHHEIKAMKAVTTKPPPPHMQAINKVKITFTDMVNSFITPFSGKKGSSCDLNGHVFPKGQWEGEYPRCTHCGKEIRSTDDAGSPP